MQALEAEAYGMRNLPESIPRGQKVNTICPEEFNQQGNRFVENAMRRMQTRFGSRLENSFVAEPDSTFYRNVYVREG